MYILMYFNIHFLYIYARMYSKHFFQFIQDDPLKSNILNILLSFDIIQNKKIFWNNTKKCFKQKWNGFKKDVFQSYYFFLGGVKSVRKHIVDLKKYVYKRDNFLEISNCVFFPLTDTSHYSVHKNIKVRLSKS